MACHGAFNQTPPASVIKTKVPDSKMMDADSVLRVLRWLTLLHVIAFVTGCPSDKADVPELPDTGLEGFTCSCACTLSDELITAIEEQTGEAYTGETVSIIDEEVCLPDGTTAANYCKKNICRYVEMAAQDAIFDYVIDAGTAIATPIANKYCVGVTCEPSDVNEEGEAVVSGVSNERPVADCDCDEDLCDVALDFSSDPPVTGDFKTCTVVTSQCGENETSDVFCRPVEITVDTADTGDEPEDTGPEAVPDDTGLVVETGGGGLAATSYTRTPVIPFSFAYKGITPEDLAACEDGSGLFVLAPERTLTGASRRIQASIVWPIQIDGTGNLAAGAWIRDVTVLPGSSERVFGLKFGGGISIGPKGRILRGADGLVPFDSVISSFDPGVLGGGTPMLKITDVEEWGIPAVMSMAWSCPAAEDDVEGGHSPAAIQTSRSPMLDGPGYSFNLTDVGCMVDWPQRFVARVNIMKGNSVLSLERLGSSRTQEPVLLSAGPDGFSYSFSYERHGLDVEGRLVGWDDDWAVVDLDAVSYQGYSLCSPGIYLLPAED